MHVCEREGCVRDVCLRYPIHMWHGIYMYVICMHTCKRTPAGYTVGVRTGRSTSEVCANGHQLEKGAELSRVNQD